MKRIALLAVDVALIVLATGVALVLLQNIEFDADKFANSLTYFAASAVSSLIVFGAANLGRPLWRFMTLQDLSEVVFAILASTATATFLTFGYNRLEGVPRSLPCLQFLTGVALLVAARLFHRGFHNARRNSRASALLCNPHSDVCSRNVLLFGLSPLTEVYLEALAEFVAGRVVVVGIVARAKRQVGRLAGAQPILGIPDALEEILHKLETHGISVHQIVLLVPWFDLSTEARQALCDAQASGIQIHDVTRGLGLVELSEADTASASNFPQLFEIPAEALSAMSRRSYWGIKRSLDVCAAFVLLIVAAPVFAVVATLTAATLGGPVLFWQQRPGLGGRPFRLYKIRTMRSVRGRKDDGASDRDRLTRAGAFLRRYRIDELPQLFNILRGDMSFIGPRPLLPKDQSASFSARLLVRPGLTGWAQVIGGRDISPVDKAALDVWYVLRASIALDLQIILRTLLFLVIGERISISAINRAFKDLSAGSILREPKSTPV